MRRFRFILPWIAAVILALPSWAQATRADEVRTRGVLRVGTTGDYQPFSYRANARSPFVGLDIELAGRLAKSLGVRLELVPTTWANLLADLHAQRFDVAMGGVSISAERS